MKENNPRHHHLRGEEVPIKIGYVHNLTPGIWVISQCTTIEKGSTWEVDMICVAPDGHRESMRQNRQIDLKYPVFYRPNFVSDVIAVFGLTNC